MEHRGERPETGASGGSAAADHGAGRRDKQAPVYPADLFDGAEFQTDGDGAGGRAAGSGFVRLLRRAGDGVLGGERIAGVLDRMTEMQDGEEEAGRPVS